jgi:uncharacterized repeat protein (TIGR01451 family)
MITFDGTIELGKAKNKKVTTFVLLGVTFLFFALAGSAHAETAVPQWTISSVSMPTNFTPNDSTSGDDFYRVLVTNSGGAPSTGPVTIADVLPEPAVRPDLAGISATVTPTVQIVGGERQIVPGGGVSCVGLRCTDAQSLPPGGSVKLTIPVDTGAATGVVGPVTNVLTVSGGGAAEASRSTLTEIGSAPAAFGIAPGSANTALSSYQAGAHANLTTTIAFDTINNQGGRGVLDVGSESVSGRYAGRQRRAVPRRRWANRRSDLARV